MVRKGNNAGFGAGALLVAHIDLRGGVFAHKDNCKARSAMALGTGSGHFRAKFRPDVGGGFFAVNQDHVKLQKNRIAAANRATAAPGRCGGRWWYPRPSKSSCARVGGPYAISCEKPADPAVVRPDLRADKSSLRLLPGGSIQP